MSEIKPWRLDSSDFAAQRQRLAEFWLAAPEDYLESLWRSPLGTTTCQLVQRLKPSSNFSSDEVSLRDRLNEILRKGLERPGCVQVLISTFLFSPPGLFSIQGPERYLPEWLLSDYHKLYSQAAQEQEPKVFSSTAVNDSPLSPAVSPTSPDFGFFPATLQDLQANRLQLNRLLGLSNLYYIDPEDHEIRLELEKIRNEFSIAILNCVESELESLWQSDLGDRYWALVRSGIQKEPLDGQAQAIKDQVTHKLTPSTGGGFGQPGAVNAMLVAMLYFVPGSMKVDGADQKLPGWLLPGYKEIFATSLNA